MSWDQPNPTSTPGAHGFIRHAPTSTGYHSPHDQPGMPTGSVGRFATIPEGKKNGGSKGFDLGAAGPVRILDFYNPNDVIVFDPATVGEDQTAAAVATSEDPMQIYHQIAVPEHEYERPMADERPTTNDRVPAGTYLVGSSRQNTPPAVQGPAPMPPQFQPAPPPPPPLGAHYGPPPQAQPLPVHYGPPPQPQPLPYYAPPPQNTGFYQHAPAPQYPPQQQQPDPAVMQELARLRAELDNQRQLADQRAHPVPPTPRPSARPQAGNGLRTLPADTPTRPPAMRAKAQQDDEDEEEPNAGEEEAVEEQPKAKPARAKPAKAAPQLAIANGFETLELPFVNGPLPMKAKRKVFFDLGGGGTSSAWYHAAIVNDDVIALVYDLRYQEGQQYAPPVLSQPLKIRIDDEEYAVLSTGLTYTVGVFDHIVLVRPGDKE